MDVQNRLVGWSYWTSHRQQGHLETAPPFTMYCPLRRMWSSINTPFWPGIEPRVVPWQSIALPLCYASSIPKSEVQSDEIYSDHFGPTVSISLPNTWMDDCARLCKTALSINWKLPPIVRQSLTGQTAPPTHTHPWSLFLTRRKFFHWSILYQILSVSQWDASFKQHFSHIRYHQKYVNLEKQQMKEMWDNEFLCIWFKQHNYWGKLNAWITCVLSMWIS